MTPAEVSLREFIEQRLDGIDDRLEGIERQTTRTNGRVDSLESWKDRLIGAVAVLSVLVTISTVAKLVIDLV